MKTRFLAIIGIVMIGTILPANAQYIGNKDSQQHRLECIGGWGMCPEQQLVQRLENDQKNAVFVLIVGVPSLVLICFIIWRKRK